MERIPASVDQGSKKVPSGCPEQVDLPAGQVTFYSHLPDRQGCLPAK